MLHKVYIPCITKSIFHVLPSPYSMYYQVHIPCITKSTFHVLQTIYSTYYKGYITCNPKSNLHIIQSLYCMDTCNKDLHIYLYYKLHIMCYNICITCITARAHITCFTKSILQILQSTYYINKIYLIWRALENIFNSFWYFNCIRYQNIWI